MSRAGADSGVGFGYQLWQLVGKVCLIPNGQPGSR